MNDAVKIYQNVLNGEKWPSKYFADFSKKTKAKDILKFIFETEGITDNESARRILTDEYIKEHRLEPLVQSIDKIPELLVSDHRDLFWFVYPELTPPKKELIHNLADDVIFQRRDSFPKKYFYGNEARTKAIICFRHLCEQVLCYDKAQLKEIFMSSKGISILSEYKLRTILQCVFSSTTQLLFAAYPNILNDK